jgi:tRNA modification GTPase
MEVSGLAVTLLDTAGLRETGDRIEAIGIARALQRAADADLRILLDDGQPVPGITPRDDDIVLLAKCDDPEMAGEGRGISGVTGAGVDWLVAEMGRRLSQMASGAGLMVRARQQDAARRGAAALSEALATMAADGRAELVAEDIRSAIRALDFLVGRIDVEDVLGDIFARFCIGK